MASGEHLRLIHIDRLPQYVPTSACLACEVCCRFPDRDSMLRPYFTGEEIARAMERGLDRRVFPDPKGSRIELVPHPAGHGYVCPAFDLATARCRIYDARPLDCRLYPLALMWSADRNEVVLGWDIKCPFIRERGQGARAEQESIEFYAERIACLLEDEHLIQTIADHPALIGRYQDDVVVLRALPRLTRRLQDKGGASWLRPVGRDDYSRFRDVFSQIDTPLAAYALAPHLMWQSSFDYHWTEFSGRLCLFASYQDGLFMPLPPLGPRVSREAVSEAFAVMRSRNHGSGVSRIENIPEDWKADFERWGYRLRAKDPDYLYDATAITELRGDRYKSPRAAYNRFIRTYDAHYAPMRPEDRDACRLLLKRWARQKEAQGLDPVARHMLTDTMTAQETLLAHWNELGVTGRVVWVDDTLVAYAFGYVRSPRVFCVLAEVADRSLDGLAAFIFRQVCREARDGGTEWINTMDDSGLVSLKRSKEQYRPLQLVPSYIATEESSVR